jgi:hypothetical protein
MKAKTLLYFFILYIFIFGCVQRQNKNKTLPEENFSQQIDPIINNPLDTFAFKGYNDIAQILSGKYPSDSIKYLKITSSESFNLYSEIIKKKWSKHQSSTLTDIEKWVNKNFEYYDTIFYPFSGPDFNYLSAFFPDAKFTVMIGLEKCGKLPFGDEISLKNFKEIFETLDKSIYTNLEYSFFRTKGMRVDLNSYLEGTLPVILMFMALKDYEIINVNPVIITNEGKFCHKDSTIAYSYSVDKDYEPYCEIVYRKKNDSVYRYLYYLSMDLSNESLDEIMFEKMVQNYFTGKICFLKAASYLMFRKDFGEIKKLILNYMNCILTGPSGIPYDDFDKNWDISYYGNYIGPIELFSSYPQNTLKTAYKQNKTFPINFKFDYHQTNHSFIVAKRIVTPY